MTDKLVTSVPRPGLRAWLESDAVQSSSQARLQQAWFGWLSFRRNPLAVLGLGIILFLCAVALFAPLLTAQDPTAQDLTRRLKPPGPDNWFGTDELGRDVYTRIVYGSRITLYIVILVAIIVAPIGLLVGATAGYLGGLADRVLMRVTDIFLSFPGLILALAFVAALGPSLENAIIAISLTSWPSLARLARAETLTVRSSDYISAARLQGASSTRIILRHIIPMCLPSLMVRITLSMGGVVLTAAGLGFLGLGAQPPLPEWGAMLSTGRRFMLDHWWLATVPGIAILFVSLGFNLLGDGLRDLLDPRSSS